MTREEIDNMALILASGSARRKEIFEAHGLKPLIMAMDVDETLPEGISPDDAVMYLALKKGLACEEALSKEMREGAGGGPEDVTASSKERGQLAGGREHALIVSADTIVYARDIYQDKWCIMGKPKDEDDAWRMLSSIRGAAHKVMTGVAVLSRDLGIRQVFCDVTDVYVKMVSDEDLHDYIDTGEPFGKAGGYAIQLRFGEYIDHIEGDFENVVGFPYRHFTDVLGLD